MPVISKKELMEQLKKDKVRPFSEKKNRIKGKYSPDQPDKFMLLHKEIRTGNNETKPSYDINYTAKEFNKAVENQSLAKPLTNIVWTERGPGNIGGRTRTIVVDYSDPSKKTWFAGAVSGGIWKTTDEGKTWVEKTKNIPNLAISTMAQAHTNPDVFYAGTGEGFGNTGGVGGSGLYKSTDHGETWQLLTSTINSWAFKDINRLIVDPSNENVVFLCANGGYWVNNVKSSIQKSTDGGLTWKKVYEADSRIQQIISSANSTDTLYATVDATGVVKSTDQGETWQSASQGLGKTGRIEIAISPLNSKKLYAAVDGGASKSSLFFTKDAALNWIEVVDTSKKNQTWLKAQGWYDNTLNVNPLNDNKVFLGGVDLYEALLLDKYTNYSGITKAEEINTQSFMSFVKGQSASGSFRYFSGGMDLGDFWYGAGATKTTITDFVSIEIRFGPGKKQLAHRFIFVSPNYEFKDYVEVPFEVWDIKNNKQLMVSFRDLENNGVYDLTAQTSTYTPREYIMVHAVDYSNSPNSTISVNNGHKHKTLYVFWPKLAANAVWDATKLPESKLLVEWTEIPQQFAIFNKLTHWYAGYKENGKLYPYIHADQHHTGIINNGNNTYRILMGNDGGVFYSDDEAKSWTEANNGYNTTQFYGADKKPSAEEFLGGMQDNGTWRSPINITAEASSKYTEAAGGDGYLGAWKYNDGNQVIGALYYNRFFKSTDGGVRFSDATEGLLDSGDGKGPFVTVVGKSNSDPELVVCTGPTGVWRSDNFATKWTLAEMDKSVNWSYSSSHTPVEISVADPQIVWAGAYMQTSKPIQVSTDGGVTFKATKAIADYGRVTGIASHPTEANTAFALLSIANKPKILKTKDLGQTWEDISGFGSNTTSSNGFPNVAVYDLVVMPYDVNIYWAFTEIGIFQSTDAGKNWAILNAPEFRAVCVWQATIVDGMIVMATHGRGIWTAKLDELSSYIPPVVTLAPSLKTVLPKIGGADIKLGLRSVYDSTVVMMNGIKVAKIGANTVKDTTISVPLTGKTDVTLYALSYKNGKSYSTGKENLTIVPFKEAKSMFISNLNDGAKDEFDGDFTISKVAGFANNAIHSPHPYLEKTNYTYTLLTPIEINETYPYMYYRDIAIVEPGDSGAVFGQAEFWDYVVVEGSLDGIQWKTLANGYDCNFDSKWLDLFNKKGTVDSTYFREHLIDLSKTFKKGDKALIRFRLFSDDASAGYGWVIDDLEIQGRLTANEDESRIPDQFVLDQNYPNPFNPATTIKFGLPAKSNVVIKIFNILGQEVTTLTSKEYSAGYHTVNWNASGYASGTYVYRIEAGDFVQSKKLMLLK